MAAGGGSSNSDEVALAARIGSSFPVRAWKTSTSVGHGGDGWMRGSKGGAGRIEGRRWKLEGFGPGKDEAGDGLTGDPEGKTKRRQGGDFCGGGEEMIDGIA